MKEISFYHLTSATIDNALPRLLERVYTSGKRAVLVTAQEKLDDYNRILWTYHPHRFLPHGTEKDGAPADQPIFLTTPDDLKNPNGAEIVVVTDGIEPDLADFSRMLDIFDGNDEEALKKARARWKKYKEQEYQLSYYQQDKAGKWEKSA